MSALAAQRRMVDNLIPGLLLSFEHTTKATKVFYKGALVCLDSGGFLVPGAATAGLRVAGIVDTGQAASVDTTGQADGDTTLKVQAGIWPFINSSAGDAIALGDLWKPCFLVDDQTVAKTDGGVGRPVAGTIVKVTSTVIYVAVGFPFGAAAAAQLPDGQGAKAASNLVTSGAMGLTRFTRFSVTGTVAASLANGTYVGQRKSIRCTVAASTPVGVLTPASVSGFATLTFGAVGNTAELEWNGTAWEIVATTATVA